MPCSGQTLPSTTVHLAIPTQPPQTANRTKTSESNCSNKVARVLNVTERLKGCLTEQVMVYLISAIVNTVYPFMIGLVLHLSQWR